MMYFTTNYILKINKDEALLVFMDMMLICIYVIAKL